MAWFQKNGFKASQDMIKAIERMLSAGFEPVKEYPI